MIESGKVTVGQDIYYYKFHFGLKVVLGMGSGKGWSTVDGNYEECPAFIRNAIQADITAKEVLRCIQAK